MAKEMIAMLLAGGQGSRLYALTEKLAKPAVPFGGKYRIIDFPLSNCVNSGIYAVRKREIDDSIFSTKWNCRFCKLLGQRIKARSLTSGKKHCYHFFCHNLSPCFNRCIHYSTLCALGTIFLCIFHYFLFFYRFYSVFFSSFTVLS